MHPFERQNSEDGDVRRGSGQLLVSCYIVRGPTIALVTAR